MDQVVAARRGVALGGFDRVAEGMAQVEQGALALFQRIAGDDLGLVLAAGGNGQGQCFAVACQQGRSFLRQPLAKAQVAQRGVLDDLGQAGAQFAWRQGGQGSGIGNHRPGRMEGTDQVLALRQIHRGLAADRGIDHRQQAGRQLYAVDAAHPAGGGKPGQVADHAAAQGQHAGITGGAQAGQGVDHPGEIVQGLGGLAGSDHLLADQQLGALLQQPLAQCRQVQRRDLVIADDQHMAATDMAGDQCAVLEQAVTDVDGVGAVTVDGDGADGSHWGVGPVSWCQWAASCSTSCAVASAGMYWSVSRQSSPSWRYSGSRCTAMSCSTWARS